MLLTRGSTINGQSHSHHVSVSGSLSASDLAYSSLANIWLPISKIKKVEDLPKTIEYKQDFVPKSAFPNQPAKFQTPTFDPNIRVNINIVKSIKNPTNVNIASNSDKFGRVMAAAAEIAISKKRAHVQCQVSWKERKQKIQCEFTKKGLDEQAIKKDVAANDAVFKDVEVIYRRVNSDKLELSNAPHVQTWCRDVLGNLGAGTGTIGACLRGIGDNGYGTHLVVNFHGRALPSPETKQEEGKLPILFWKAKTYPKKDGIVGKLVRDDHGVNGRDYDIVELYDGKVCECRGVVDGKRIWDNLNDFLTSAPLLMADGLYQGVYLRGYKSGMLFLGSASDPEFGSMNFDTLPGLGQFLTTKHRNLVNAGGDSGAGLIYRLEVEPNVVLDVLIGIVLGNHFLDDVFQVSVYTPIWNVMYPPNTRPC